MKGYGHIKPVRAVIEGRVFNFRSTWEYNYALYLQYLTKLGVLKEWGYEAMFLRYKVPKHYKIKGYLTDFTFKKTGEDKTIFVEIKGRMDSRSRFILQGLSKHHPNVNVFVIRQQQYYKIIKSFYQKIPFILSPSDKNKIK